MSENNNIFDTSTIEYEYTIINQLYENKTIYTAILNEVKKIINSQIDLLYNEHDGTILYEKKGTTINYNDPVIEKIQMVSSILFKNIPIETGQIGNDIYVFDYTQGKKTKSKTQIKTINDLYKVVDTLNLRESMTVLKNFHRGNNNCFMYKILLKYKQSIIDNKQQEFIEQYPMLNIDTINSSIEFIENTLGIDILTTKDSYNIKLSNNKLNILNKIEKTTRQTLPFYEFIEKNNNYNNPITLCYLWHPLSVQIPYQVLTKMSQENILTNIVNSFKMINKDKNSVDKAVNCTKEKVKLYPPVPPLSNNEINYLNLNGKTDNWIDNIKWKPSICYHTEIQPNSFVLKQLKKENKLSISNYSGHTSLLLMICSYFKNVNYELLVLANMIWTVPYNHSIHEVFMGSKMMNVFPEYNYKESSFKNVNTLLEKVNLPTLTNSAVWNGKTYVYEQNTQNGGKKNKKSSKTTKKTVKWSNISPAKSTLKKYKKKYGSKCFLLSKENKYPICNKYTGKVSCKGLLAAHYRAMLSVYRKLKPKTYSYKKIAKKARKTAKRYKCNWVK